MEIIFVYNARSDKINKLIDFAHKIISPSTYSCDLCTLTHTNFGQQKDWKAFLENSSYLLHVYYKDQFEKKFKKTFEYPIILNLAGDEISIILDKNEIAKIDNLPDLLKEVLIKTGHQTP